MGTIIISIITLGIGLVVGFFLGVLGQTQAQRNKELASIAGKVNYLESRERMRETLEVIN